MPFLKDKAIHYNLIKDYYAVLQSYMQRRDQTPKSHEIQNTPQ